MTPFSERDVTVVLTGAEWTTVLARIVNPENLSKEGRAIYRDAAGKLQKQLLAEAKS